MQKWPLAQLGMLFGNLCYDNISQLMGWQMNRMTAMESVARLPIRDITFHFWQQTHPPRHNLVDWGPFAIINRNKSQLAHCRTWSTFCNLQRSVFLKPVFSLVLLGPEPHKWVFLVPTKNRKEWFSFGENRRWEIQTWDSWSSGCFAAEPQGYNVCSSPSWAYASRLDPILAIKKVI